MRRLLTSEDRLDREIREPLVSARSALFRALEVCDQLRRDPVRAVGLRPLQGLQALIAKLDNLRSTVPKFVEGWDDLPEDLKSQKSRILMSCDELQTSLNRVSVQMEGLETLLEGYEALSIRRDLRQVAKAREEISSIRDGVQQLHDGRGVRRTSSSRDDN